MIKFPQLRVIIADSGENLGVVSTRDALNKSLELGLDLVIISDKSNPPVAKIIDYGKYRYEKKKAEKQQLKNQKVSELKEVRLSVNIAMNDLEIKIRKAIEFIERGDKVRVTLKLRGREIPLIEIAREKMRHFIKSLDAVAKVEKENNAPNFLEAILMAKK